jgi:predicted metal-dependent hydrolase
MAESPLIQPRVPQVDWQRGFARHWNGGSAVRTHIFNALSFLFPQGERFFIEQARAVAEEIHATGADLRAFIGQEAIHARQHAQYNDVLVRQGYENVSADLAQFFEDRAYRLFSPLTRLAAVCAYEHYTAALGDYVLSYPPALDDAPAELALIWGWHAVEETEHKAVCFDLYKQAGGGWLRRVLMMLLVSINFSRLFWRLYMDLLRRDGALAWRRLPRTIAETMRVMAGVHGIGWYVVGAWLRYLSPGFHPWNHDNRQMMQHWLAAHQSSLRPVWE